MKRCPTCSKIYDDESIFCSIDAQALVSSSDFSDIDDTPVINPPLKPVPSQKKSTPPSPGASPGLPASPESPVTRTETRQPDPFIGKTLNNKFRIDALLGRGGMGAVYRATDIVLDRTVAVKLLRQDLLGDENLDSRFLREARAAARIEHPHAVTVHDFGTLAEGNAFIVMEFIQGLSLRDLLKRGGAMQPARAIEVMKQACSAVAAAHQVGVIHRDLKPENIMLKDVGVGFPAVKVVDFGLAKLKESVSQSLINLTTKGEIIGTPYYMSPEQCNGSEIDERTDIYSLGIIFYEMLMGRAPFQGSAAAVIGMHLYKPVPALSDINPNVPAVLGELVLEMLHKEREKRPNTLAEILRQLDSLQRAASQALASHPESIDTTDKAKDLPFSNQEASAYPLTRQKAETLKVQEPADQAALTNGAANNAKSASSSARNNESTDPLAPGNYATKGDNSSRALTLIASEPLPTQEQMSHTVHYDSEDFRTRPSAPLTARPKIITSPISSNSPSLEASSVTPRTMVVTRPPKISYKKISLIGLFGIIFGIALAFFLQPVFAPSKIQTSPQTSPSTGGRPSTTSTPKKSETQKKSELPTETQPDSKATPDHTIVPPTTDGHNRGSNQQNTEKAKIGKNDPATVWRAIVGKKS